MGWWCEDIMGGDEPLDARDSIYDEFGIDPDNNQNYSKLNCEVLLNYVDTTLLKRYYQKHVVYGTVGIICMDLGLSINDHSKQLIIEAVNSEDVNSWNDPNKRKASIQNFIHCLTQYSGTPTIIPQRGLFDVMFAEQLI